MSLTTPDDVTYKGIIEILRKISINPIYTNPPLSHKQIRQLIWGIEIFLDNYNIPASSKVLIQLLKERGFTHETKAFYAKLILEDLEDCQQKSTPVNPSEF